jgi:hypothetical protein
MRRPRGFIAVALALLALTLAGCGGGDDDDATATPAAPDSVEAPERTAPPAGAPGELPPEFVKCMAERGFDIATSAEIHSAPPDVLQVCFQSLHSGGG